MVRSESPGTGSQRRAAALVLLLPPFVTAVVAAVAVCIVSGHVRIEVAWCGTAAVAAVALMAAETAHHGRVAHRLRERLAQEQAAHKRTVNAHVAETRRMINEVLPSSVARLREIRVTEDSMVDVSDSPDIHPAFREAHQTMIRVTLNRIEAEQHLRDALQFSFVDIARRIQAIVNTQAVDLRDMEDKYGMDDRVFGDILKLDHGNALIGRLADTISVLGGSRPGRQWENVIPLYSVLRGGMSRILDYRRVELHPVPDIGIRGSGVEPVIHALAELLDNACRYSPPISDVHLTAVEVHEGLAIEIEDGGIGLTMSARERCETVIRQQEDEIDFEVLGETPRLGLTVVGRLCKVYGLKVRLRDSAYGGVRAVMIVPAEYMTTASPKSWAHGIGTAAGPRKDTTTTPRSVAEEFDFEPARSTAAPPRKPKSKPKPQPPTAPGVSARTAGASSTPYVPNSPAGFDDEYIVTERTDAGLPQRRRDPDAKKPLLLSQRQTRAKAEAEARERARQARNGGEKKPWQPPGGEWLDQFLLDVQEDRRKEKEKERGAAAALAVAAQQAAAQQQEPQLEQPQPQPQPQPQEQEQEQEQEQAEQKSDDSSDDEFSDKGDEQ